MTAEATILAVDDKKSALLLMKSQLRMWDFDVLCATGGAEALAILEETSPDLILSDQVMPDMDGLALLQTVKRRYPDIPFILVTAHGKIEHAVTAVKKGADDYLVRPYRIEELEAAVRRALKYSIFQKERQELKAWLDGQKGFGAIVGQSSRLLDALELARQVAKSPRTIVCLYGESGTGKELLARAIHLASGCMETRFVGVNCAGIPPSLLESELFGYVKGAFTGADKGREGKFGMARKGTLLLDEIGDLPFEIQGKLLRVLQEGTYEKLGSDGSLQMDFRVIAATNQHLERLVEAKRFREDLYHRINVYPIALPALRDRKEDIPLLAEHFMGEFRQTLGKKLPGIAEPAMDLLINHSWPGNVRELKNCLERAAILSKGELIQPAHLPAIFPPEISAIGPADKNDKIRLEMTFDPAGYSLDAVINRVLKLTLEQCGDNKAEAARILKVNRNMFYRRPTS